MKPKWLTQLICAVLLLALLFSMAGCGGNGETSSEQNGTTAAVNTEDTVETTAENSDGSTPDSTEEKVLVNEPISSEKGKAISDGDEVNVLYWIRDMNLPYDDSDIWSADLFQDTPAGSLEELKECVYNRNSEMQSLYGIEINAYSAACDQTSLYQRLMTLMDTQSDKYDMIYLSQTHGMQRFFVDHFYDINTIVDSEGDKILNIDKSYWNGELCRELNYGEELYYLSIPFATSNISSAIGTFVNLDLYEACVQEAYGGRSIFEIAESGEWTVNMMLNMAELAADNGYTGILYDNYYTPRALMTGMGAKLSESKESEAGEEIVLSSFDSEAFTAFANTMKTLSSASYAKGYLHSDSAALLAEYAESQTLFTFRPAAELPSVHKEDGLIHAGVIPPPKMNTLQEEYHVPNDGGAPVMMISKYSKHPIASAIVLDYMAYYTSDPEKSLLPSFAYAMIEEFSCRCDRPIYVTRGLYLLPESAQYDFITAWSEGLGGIYDTEADFADYTSVEGLEKLFGDLSARKELILEVYENKE